MGCGDEATVGTLPGEGTVKISSELGMVNAILQVMLDAGVELRLITCGNWLFPFSSA